MQTHQIEGHTVNSSFDRQTTETMLRSGLALARALANPGFEQMSDQEQERLLMEYYFLPLPSPDPKNGSGFHMESPVSFVLETGETVVLNAAGGQWFVLLEKEMLTFRPTKP